MNIFVVSSTEDPAGSQIAHQLLQQKTWEQHTLFDDHPTYTLQNFPHTHLITINDRTIYHDHLDTEIKDQLGITPDLIIFLSRHSSKKGTPTLTTHPIGNYASADFGGKPQTLIPSNPHFMTQLLRKIYFHHQHSTLNYQVCFEVTHHGPYLETPTIYAEVGSTESQWNDPEPARIVATAVYQQLLEQNHQSTWPTIIGIGGGHYAPRFTDIILEKQVSFGHMIPSYHIDTGAITPEIIKEAVDQTPNASAVYIHSKGLKKPQIREYTQICESLKLPIISSKILDPFM